MEEKVRASEITLVNCLTTREMASVVVATEIHADLHHKWRFYNFETVPKKRRVNKNSIAKHTNEEQNEGGE